MRQLLRTATREREITIPVGHVSLRGTLRIPEGARGVVLFAHGSGSSRLSPRNRQVADVLVHRGLATLLFDLLTPAESERRSNVFDVGLLAERLRRASDWIAREFPGLPIGYFGASTGAAAALRAARGDSRIHAIVSRGGRPDLAGEALRAITTPTLLIVGGDDVPVLALNEQALHQLAGVKRLEVIPGATHLFEEPGALEQVADLAASWLDVHLRGKVQQ